MRSRVAALSILLGISLGCTSRVSAPRLSAIASSEERLGVRVERLDETDVNTTLAQQATRRVSFVPLAPGNRWNYDHLYRTIYWSDARPASPETLQREVVDVSGTACPFRDDITGRDYVGYLYAGFPERRWSIQRQDEHGLWSLGGDDTFVCPDTDPAEPSFRGDLPLLTRGSATESRALLAAVRSILARAASHTPGSPETSEHLVLEYPLHVGRSWSPRANTRATVVALERVETGEGPQVAFEIDLATTTPFGTSHSSAWYGRIGLVATFVEASGIVTDGEGHRMGTFHFVDRAVLTRHWLGAPDGPFVP